MNRKEAITEIYKDKHPGIGSYLECTTRAYGAGLAGFTLGFSSIYFTQKVIQRYIPYKLKINILISSVTGCLCAYKVSSDRNKICQAAWLASEEKVTALSEIKSETDKQQ